ncbi:MAG TPA: tetraacyldisaccharide 4'-kinase [Xanthobacteraceae bacterium]|nr:tetraacyldisaccharide 4'-kinase [Xanthobacteraceae bacterium]
MREPPFWWRPGGSAAAMLAPFAAVYGAVAARRLARNGVSAGVPVVCIGNPTVGGAGKTPAALTIASMLAVDGETPVFLTRGYGGRLTGPVWVVPLQNRAADVGDEPLLLARVAPTIVARDRVAGAQGAVAAGASVIVMDDGFQNPSLAKDFSVLVVDGRRGIGNGRTIPAGPLRAPLAAQLDRAQALIVVGEGGATGVADEARKLALPVFGARLAPDAAFTTSLAGKRVLAFAGIGDPEKFFTTLRMVGVTVAAARGFDDHHRYTRADAQALCAEAERDGLALVTTEKDLARMQGDEYAAELAARSRALPVTLAFDDDAGFRSLLREQVTRAR